jgi:hypothetical protein
LIDHPPGSSRAASKARALSCALGLVAAIAASTGGAQAAPRAIDRVVARFYAPETGGANHPRFVLERGLAFEARLEAMAASSGAAGGYEERDVRAALDHVVAEQLLASLADKLIVDSPAEKRPLFDEIPRIEHDLDSALLERFGGRPRVEQAADDEQIDATEVTALVHRAALAAWYLDRAVSPILHPSEEQLREVYRTAAHPYRGRPFAETKDALARWFVVERLRVAEVAFLQSARSRVHVIVTQ